MGGTLAPESVIGGMHGCQENAVNHIVKDGGNEKGADANAVDGGKERLQPCPPCDVIFAVIQWGSRHELGVGFSAYLLKISASGKKAGQNRF